jgi:DNA-binding NtrC family response regulator
MNFVFQSATMQALVARVKSLAACDANVFISGECGAGKKAIARLIHDRSRPPGAPFVCIPCASIEGDGPPPSGTANGARGMRQCLASAAGGTLVLDEVADLLDDAQRALLEYLTELELPSSRNEANKRPPHCICTTRVPVAALAHGGLRNELFHRLFELHLVIPPLREHVEDVTPLAEHFLSQLRQQQMGVAARLEPAALARLQQHGWPGNVRELRNTLYRACFAAGDSISVEVVEASLLPSAVEAPQHYDQLKLEEIERRVILRRLDRFHGNKAKAAIDLGVTDRTLRNKMRLYRESGQLGDDRR